MHAMQCNAMQCNAIQEHYVRYNAVQFYVMECNAIYKTLQWSPMLSKMHMYLPLNNNNNTSNVCYEKLLCISLRGYWCWFDQV